MDTKNSILYLMIRINFIPFHFSHNTKILTELTIKNIHDIFIITILIVIKTLKLFNAVSK